MTGLCLVVECMKEEFVIIDTQDGSHSIFSPTFGVTYHSKYGAIQESQHVFIEAGLYEAGLHKKELSILGIGFGTGLNALMTSIEATRRDLNISYTAVENFPVPVQEAVQLNYPEVLNAPEYRPLFEKMHEMDWGQQEILSPNFQFRKLQKTFQSLQFKQEFDLIYFDAFAPSTQPELWEEDVLSIMYEALMDEGLLVTYCAKGAVKRSLKSLGFMIEALKGPPGKREMTRAKKAKV